MSEQDRTGFEPVDLSRRGTDVERFTSFMGSRLIGQPRAIKHAASALQDYWAGLKDPTKPIGVFLCPGPTGTGKTFFAKNLAEFLIPDCPILPYTRIKCETLTERFQISQLIGASPNYIGYGETPPLEQSRLDEPAFRAALERAIKEGKFKVKVKDIRETDDGDKIEYERDGDPHSDSGKAKLMREIFRRRNGPYPSVILFDEIEKMHPDGATALMNVFDEASLTLGNGKTTDFSHSIIVLTSNIGADEIDALLRGKNRRMGFASVDEGTDETGLEEEIYRRTIDRLRKHFKPEFIARLRDHIIVFRPLSLEESLPVLENMLDEIRARLRLRFLRADDPVNLSFTLEFKDYVLKKGHSKEEGLRRLQQAVNKHVREPLSIMLTTGQVASGDDIIFDIGLDGLPRVRRRRSQVTFRLPPPRTIGTSPKPKK